MSQLRIKYFTTKVGSGKTPRGGAEVYQDQGIPLFRSQNVTNEGLLLDDIAYISEDIDEEMAFTRTKPLDVLLNITGASLGRCYYIPNDFVRANVNQHVCIIRPIQKIVITTYLYYLIVSPVGQEQIKLALTGGNRDGLSFEVIRNLSFNIPSIFEQQNIVEYLDSKCSNIDASIAALSEMKEKYLFLKKSLINETVCRGLNKNVPLKSSGIDWTGDIPEHWEVKRFKAFAYTQKGKSADYYDDPAEGLDVVLSLNYLRNDSIDFVDYADASDKSQCCDVNDILIIWDGAGVGEILKSRVGVLSSTLAKLIVNERIVSKGYFWYYRNAIDYVLKKNPTGMGIPHLNPLVLNNMKFPIPPLEEQFSIATYLDTQCSRIDAIVENIDSQIEVYTKLKKSLISEVVTGKKQVI